MMQMPTDIEFCVKVQQLMAADEGISLWLPLETIQQVLLAANVAGQCSLCRSRIMHSAADHEQAIENARLLQERLS